MENLPRTNEILLHHYFINNSILEAKFYACCNDAEYLKGVLGKVKQNFEENPFGSSCLINFIGANLARPQYCLLSLAAHKTYVHCDLFEKLTGTVHIEKVNLQNSFSIDERLADDYRIFMQNNTLTYLLFNSRLVAELCLKLAE